jgi:hypothetical protein
LCPTVNDSHLALTTAVMGCESPQRRQEGEGEEPDEGIEDEVEGDEVYDAAEEAWTGGAAVLALPPPLCFAK